MQFAESPPSVTIKGWQGKGSKKPLEAGTERIKPFFLAAPPLQWAGFCAQIKRI
jgi:hypothetical protein